MYIIKQKASRLAQKPLIYLLSTLMGLIGLTQVGCVSGGFQLTRKYARIVNRQHIILRIILFVLTLPVYAITLLIDAVVFNTMDFWEGRVSANTYQFQEGEKLFVVEHSFQEGTSLKKSKIQILSQNKTVSVLELVEQQNGKIKVIEDGALKALVEDIHGLPNVTYYKGGAPEGSLYAKGLKSSDSVSL